MPILLHRRLLIREHDMQRSPDASDQRQRDLPFAAAKALLQHYRRHPLQLALLLAGILIGVVMVNGVALLNQAALSSYQRGEQLLGLQAVAFVEPRQGRGTVPQQLYIDLRNQGFDELVPVLSGTVQTEGGKRLSLIGTDPLAFAANSRLRDGDGQQNDSLADFILSPFQARLSPQRARQLGAAEGDSFRLKGREELLAPIKIVSADGLGHRLWVDIGYAQTLLQLDQQLSYIAVMSDAQLEQIKQRLPEELSLRPARDSFSLLQMTGSLHLNLTAMGLLAWVVGVFIVYNAVSFSLQDRRPLLGQLQIAGVPRRTLQRLVAAELTLLTLIAALAAMPLSVWLAGWLLPVMGRTLDNLYGVGLAYPQLWSGQVAVRALLVAFGGMLLAAAVPLYRIATILPLEGIQLRPLALRALGSQRRLLYLGGLFLLLGVLVAWISPGLKTGFVVLALLLMGSALCLPWVFSTLLSLASHLLPGRFALLRWSCGELNWQMAQSGLAMMALVLALTANAGVNTMVGSFRDAVNTWLSQRLIADVYFRPAQHTQPLRQWLTNQDDVAQIFTQQRLDIWIQGQEIELLSLHDSAASRQALALRTSADQHWDLFLRGEGVLISERLHLLQGWNNGDRLSISAQHPALPVVGIYYDYGNPVGQMMIHQPLFEALWPELEPSGVGAKLRPDSDDGEFLARVRAELPLTDNQVIAQRQLKQIALNVFEQTFVVTHALNLLTLLVAAVGLSCALLLLANRRRQGLAVLASMGTSKRSLYWVSLLQWAAVGGMLALLSLPFGIVLAWVLINLLNVYGFGWSYPLTLQPLSYLQLLLVSCLVTMLTAIFPLQQLRRNQLVRQLSEEV